MNILVNMLINICFLLFCQISYASAFLDNKVVFEGLIKGTKFSSIQFYLFPDVAYIHIKGMSGPIFTIAPDQNGYFHLELPWNNYAERAFVYITVKENNNETAIINDYCVIEDKDSINIVLEGVNSNRYGVEFTGKGAERFKCQQEIDRSLNISLNSSIFWNDERSDYYTIEYFKKLWLKSTSFPSYGILKSYKNRIDPSTYNILYANIQGRILNSLTIISDRIVSKTDPKQRDQVCKSLDDFFNVVRSKISVKSQLLSHAYFNFLKAQLGSELYRQKGQKVSLKDAYDKIKAKFVGDIRDYLLTAQLDFGNRFPEDLNNEMIDSLWKDASITIRIPLLIDYINKVIAAKTTGSPAYNFSLPDSSQHIFRLEAFKGKVLLIHIWYTGCGGCSGFSNRLESIVYSQFKNDSNVVFISISGDKYWDQWVSSLRSGNYTGKSDINLFTEGLGFEHPFMKHYNFRGGPYALLIDSNGRIFSGNPPTKELEKLNKLIEKALAEIIAK